MGFMNWMRAQWDRAIALVALIIGLLAFLLGWLGVSGQPYVAKQLPYIVSGALFGIFMVGVAAVLWLSADLRDEWRELRGIRLLLDQPQQAAANPVDTGERVEPDLQETTELPQLPAYETEFVARPEADVPARPEFPMVPGLDLGTTPDVR